MNPRRESAPSPDTQILPPAPPPFTVTDKAEFSSFSQLQRYAAAVIVRPSAAAAVGASRWREIASFTSEVVSSTARETRFSHTGDFMILLFSRI